MGRAVDDAPAAVKGLGEGVEENLHGIVGPKELGAQDDAARRLERLKGSFKRPFKGIFKAKAGILREFQLFLT